MTLTILVSFSLLALVVTARPILPRDTSDLADSSKNVQEAVQAIFLTRTGLRPDCLTCDEDQDVRVHVTSPEEQTTYLSQLDGLDAVKAIVPLRPEGVLTDDEKQLYDLLHGESGGSLNDLDGGERPLQIVDEDFSKQHPQTEEVVPDVPPPSEVIPATPPLLVLTFSCIAALVALLCITTAVYALYYVRTQLMKSSMIWDILPQLGKRTHIDESPSNGGNSEISEVEKNLLDFEGKLECGDLAPSVLEKCDVTRSADDTALRDAFTALTVQDLESDDLDEKFIDAEDSPFLAGPEYQQVHKPPLVGFEEYPDPDLLPLPPISTPFLTPEGTPTPSLSPLPTPRPAPMRELTSSPVSKPAWSLRAADAPSFALAGPSSAYGSPTASPRIPGALFPDSLTATDTPETSQDTLDVPGRRRAYRAPIPELDIAFALQLRPGLGLGADPAWLVRFLMAMFGWMTVLIGGGTRGAGQLRA